jgi:uncharacterized membrane protein (UPF0127 family)
MSKPTKTSNTPQKNNSSFYRFVFIAVIVLIAGYIIFISFFDNNSNNEYRLSTDKTDQFDNIEEPQFKKEGELEFLKKDGKTFVSKIDIEIADNTQERMQGLMYRKEMDEDKGMLFIFQEYEQQGFYMKNTIMPLDIIFLDSTKQIIKIFKNTIPFSEKTIPSGKPAMYVVEVNAGYTDRNGVEVGDKVEYVYR